MLVNVQKRYQTKNKNEMRIHRQIEWKPKADNNSNIKSDLFCVQR